MASEQRPKRPGNKLPATKTTVVPQSSTAGAAVRQPSHPFPEQAAGHERKLLGWRWGFIATLATLAILYWTGGWGTGVNSDEIDMLAYGKANINWYASGGTNMRFLREPLHGVMPTLKYYGSGFEYLAQGVLAVIKPSDGWEYDIRHVLNQTLAIIGILFAGLLARRWAGWRAATFTALVLGLTPAWWGHALFDTKDIPFAVGYVAAFYFFVRLAEDFPKVTFGHLVGLAFSLLFACSVRIGAVVIFPAFGAVFLHSLFRYRRSGQRTSRPVLRWVGAVLLAVGAAIVGTVLLWPYAMLDPVAHVMEALTAATRFPQRISFLWAGEDYNSLGLPSYYLIKALGATLPVGILILFGAGAVGLLDLIRRGRGSMPALTLLLASGAPLAFAVITEMPVYNGWRHVLFIYPPAVAALLIGVEAFVHRIPTGALQTAACVGVGVALIPSTAWSVQHQPYQYQYYNEFVGGYNGAANRYDTDYWQMSLREAFDWIAENEAGRNGKPVTIATNGSLFGQMYMLQKYPKLKARVNHSSFKARHANDWDYAVFSNLFLKRGVAEHQWPPLSTAHTVENDDVLLAVVLFDTLRYDYEAISALRVDKPKRADSFLRLYLAQIGYRPEAPAYLGPLDGYIGFTHLALGDTANAVIFAQRSLDTDPLDLVANITAGLVLMGRGQWQEAYEFFSIAQAVDRSAPLVNNAMAELEAKGVKRPN